MAARLKREGATLEAIERVYRARLPELRRVAAAICGDRELARDAVQDAFALAVRNRGAFHGGGSLEAWLWRIVVNAAIGQRRRPNPALALQQEPQAAANGQPEPGADHVRSALMRVSERQRLTLFLRYYADLDYAVIAAVLEISPGTVGATLHSARAAMRRLLEEEVVQ